MMCSPTCHATITKLCCVELPQAFPGETVWLSGGYAIRPEWKPYSITPAVWSVHYGVSTIDQLSTLHGNVPSWHAI